MRVLSALNFVLLTLSLLIFSTLSMSQQTIKNYEQEWKKVEDFNSKSLPKSALAEVNKIYSLAKKENQEAQVIKALVYMMSLNEELEENNDSISIRKIENEIKTAKAPAKNILYSLLAKNYYSLYNQLRWKILSRTATVDFVKTDVYTWGNEDFHRKIAELYLLSLKDEQLLQSTSLKPYDAIILKGNMRHLRPTLYDLLAQNALEYFKSDERTIKKPAYAFEIAQENAFAPAEEFARVNFITSDTLSLEHKALTVYQRLISMHLKDAKPDALIDVDIQRISFVYSKSVHAQKESLYIAALENIRKKYGSLPAASMASYLIAAYYESKASSYTPYGDSTYRLARIKAKEYLDGIVAQKDSSEGKSYAINLLSNILRSSLTFNVEKANLPGKPFRTLVQYRNLNTLHLRLIKSTDKIKESLNEGNMWKTILAAPSIREWKQNLPATQDLQQHSVEIKIDALPAGDYMLIATNSEKFSLKESIVAASSFSVSNISFVNSGLDYFILHRETGQPLNGASVQVWEHKYDYKLSRYITQKQKLYKADKNGYVKLEEPEEKNRYQAIFLDITHNGERFFQDERVNDYYYYYGDEDDEEQSQTSVFVFTDRGLYRPGQTVHFKGIVLQKNNKGKSAEVRADYPAMVSLFDVNGQRVDSIRLTTNEFGSFSGKFQLPSNLLNGTFSITTSPDESSTQIQVEEYKRPKFVVEYEPIKGSYRVNDTITVTGVAKAYAGNNIDGAKVSYRVVRTPRFLYPWLSRKWWFPPAAPMEIIHGETTTDKDGKFEVRFKAIPDLSIDRKFEPAFDYNIYADVTDINGETRSAQQNVSVSYKSLLLSVQIPERIEADSLKTLIIRTSNLNNEFQKANVTVTISRQKEEQRLLRPRYWTRPDQFIMNKAEYISFFPNDEYDNESDQAFWKKEAVVHQRSDTTKVSGEFAIGNQKLKPGYYVIEVVTTDKDGNEVKSVNYIEIYEGKEKKLARPEYLWADGVDRAFEPGEKASIKIGSSSNDVFVIQKIERGNARENSSAYSFSSINNEKKDFDHVITEADRGGFGISYLFIKNNRVYQFNQTIAVPWTNKDLKIEYATFRDKTLPGSEEKWKVKITGYKNEKVAAEMLASMYDASLDQFYPFGWSRPSLWNNFYYQKSWSSTHNFSHTHSLVSENISDKWKQINKVYDEFIWDLNEYRYDYYKPQRKNARAEEGMLTESISGRALGLKVSLDEVVVTGNQSAKDTTTFAPPPAAINESQAELQVRKNFNETAFFLPDLRTDSEGNIEFSFTMPEALTRWKFQALSHTKDLSFGYSAKEIVTQKDLMVQPNAPRFIREGDKIEFSAKIVNMTEKEITGQVELLLFDAATNQSVDGWFKNVMPNQYFTVGAGQSEVSTFSIQIPFQFSSSLSWRIVARAGNVSDGEENVLPVLSNRMLVTESLPLNMRTAGTKEFKFDKLINSGASESLQHHSLTIEYTSNPVWTAVQSLPYLMEYPFDCAEQVWNRYYANSLATMIANSSPKIQAVFEKWKITDTTALFSNLQKNQELKSLLLEETPWVLQAKTEAEQKRNIALLFDLSRMSREINSAFEKFSQMQSSNGGFVWFPGGQDNRYITQYIVTGIGHLIKLKAVSPDQLNKLESILATAISYLDRKVLEDYNNLKKYKTDLTKYVPDNTTIQYLYMRSFFPQRKIPNASKVAVDYFTKRVRETWTKQTKYMQGMAALALHRGGDVKTPAAILKSLKETSIVNDELGMYWKDARRGWFWHEAPIERQALLIEAFAEISKDDKTVDDLKTWLLKNKQTNNWESTKATAEACYALLLQGSSWINTEMSVAIRLGGTEVKTDREEAGTGYIKETIESKNVKPSQGNISVTVTPGADNKSSTSWGAVYWQYFEDLDKITGSSTPLKLEKKLFVEKNSDRGPVLTPVNDGDALSIGDKVRVRIELRVDRDMEFVHMKDMRASSMEPVNVISGYRWQGGLGYYETTRDASTNFFFDNLRKGTYVFEYSLFVTHKGNFSNGVTSIQSMYAPEFTSHSEGIRINVE